MVKTQWNDVRKGAILGIFAGWVAFISCVVYCVGFIFAAIRMSHENQDIVDLSDVIVVSNSYNQSTKKQII